MEVERHRHESCAVPTGPVDGGVHAIRQRNEVLSRTVSGALAAASAAWSATSAGVVGFTAACRSTTSTAFTGTDHPAQRRDLPGDQAAAAYLDAGPPPADRDQDQDGDGRS